MKTKKIEIDIEVYRWIESNRISFDETENDILKRVSQRIQRNEDGFVPINIEENIMNINEGLFWKGILLKNGLRLRKLFKGKIYYAEIKNNQIVFNNKKFHSPSAAAIELTGTSVNGWIFWEYFNQENNEWEILDNLRNK